MRKRYHSLKEVKEDLKILRLQRDISLAELESRKMEVEETFTLNGFLSTALQGVKKYGIFFLIKKIFRL